MKLPISAIVVGYNEVHLLENSLPKLAFCDELLYFDLGSRDNSREFAESLGAKVILHEKVDGCEWIHAKYSKSTKHNWVLITDPDEVLSDELIDEIRTLFDGDILGDDVGAIRAPMFFYFKDKRLNGTNWGGVSHRVLIVNNQRFEFSGLVHAGRKVADGFVYHDIKFTEKNYIHHYWMLNYKQLFEKHRRYLKNEGEARYRIGRRTSFKEILKQPYRAFKYSFVSARGYKDGFTGLFLSLFWAWYECSAHIKNYRYQANKASTKSKS